MVYLKKTSYFFSFLIIIFVLITCTSYEASQPLNFTDIMLLSSIDKFDPIERDPASFAITYYFKPYADIIPNLTIHSGYYPSDNELLVAHFLTGTNSQSGTAILIHGFNGNALDTNLQYFAQQFIKNGYGVIILNLPGHGFSGGYRSSVDNFEEYGNMVTTFLHQYEKKLQNPLYMAGISTGALAIFDGARKDKIVNSSIEKYALIVPFLYMKHAGALEFGSYLTDSVHSRKSGPMTIYNIATKWIQKSQDWAKKRKKEQLIIKKDKVFITFAEDDNVINFKKSYDFYKKTYPNAKINVYPNQDHTFTKETYQAFRNDIMSFFLNKK